MLLIKKGALKWQFLQMGKDLFKVWNWFGISMKTKPYKNNWLWFANELFREWMYVFLC